ncbi:unnamed protein product [Amoebophrya sp. A25]|nr:unnamed protein product [Amoebophrya sp. A25]|eukprot:GSA25T00020703001.1
MAPADHVTAGRVIFPLDGPPLARREDGMSLDVVDAPGASKPYFNTRELITLQSWNVHEKKRQLIHPPKEDISRQKTYYPTPLHRPRDLSLTTADIPFAQPALLETSGRHTDPVQPVYQFLGATQVKPVEPFVPRNAGNFILVNSDVDGAAPRKLIPDRNYVRDLNDSSDIAYSTPHYHLRHVKSQTYLGRGKEVYGEDPAARAPRQYRDTNPLDPEYRVSQLPKGYDGYNADPRTLQRPLEIGRIPGSKPRKLQWSNSEPTFNLMTEDVAGAMPQRWVGELPTHIYAPKNERSKPPLNLLIHDIPGAQVGTAKPGLANSRNTNPLLPTYKFLDGTLSPWNLRGSPSAGGQISAPQHRIHVFGG